MAASYARFLVREETEETPEWLRVLWFEAPWPDWLLEMLNDMPDHPAMPVITNAGNNCSLFENPQNLHGILRRFSMKNAPADQPRGSDGKKTDPWLSSDIMNHALADFGKRSNQKDTLLQNMLNAKTQWLARPPAYGMNLLGDSTLPAYRKIDGADWLEGYHATRG